MDNNYFWDLTYAVFIRIQDMVYFTIYLQNISITKLYMTSTYTYITCAR